VEHEAAFERSIEAHLLASGWNGAEAAGYDRLLGLHPDELIAFITASQPKGWGKYVTHRGGEPIARQKLLERVASELTKRGTVDVLRRGVKDSGVSFELAFFAPANDLTPELWTAYEANRTAVVRQLHHSESNPKSSLDLTMFLNGIPVATAELKNPLSGQNVEHAMTQYRTDRNPSDLIFKHRSLVHFTVDQHQVYMSTRLLGEATRFLPFNTGSNGPGHDGGAGNPANPDGYATAYLWEQVWARDAWLNLLGSFVHVEAAEAGGQTLFPRFHQWHAVKTLLEQTKLTGPGTNRLVQHSAGSGKSNTIAWLAHGLSRLHTPSFHGQLTESLTAAGLGVDQPVFDKVIVITDRTVLDRQLQSTVAGFEHVPGAIQTITEDSKQLKAALEGAAARIIVTTLQKFPVVAQVAAEQAAAGEESGKAFGKRFAVIIDEAHSSASGEAMKDLKVVLGGDLKELPADDDLDASDLVAASMQARGKRPNLAFFAFTATPKPKTLEMFGELETDPAGEQVRVPSHLYSMRQAIAEGFILDVLASYTTYETYYRLATDAPDDTQVPVGKAAAWLTRFVSLHESNLAQKAQIIVEHFRDHVRHQINGQAKAMVVTRSRLHAVRYHQAIEAYIKQEGYDHGPDAVKSLVAFSGSVTDPSAPSVVFTEAAMNGFGEAQLPKQFATDEYQVLVVAEKYQTGFDQPLLHTMYVDKKLGGVKAVQTLSRLNRTHPGKANTFVLDFANTAEEIRDAFAPFYTRTTATPTDPNILYTLQQRLEDALVLHPDEVAPAVDLLLEGNALNQKAVYALLDPAVARYLELPAGDASEAVDGPATRYSFRSDVQAFTSAYSFLAQVMSWADPDLERLYIYLRALFPLLPPGESDPLPQLGDSVMLTHLRTEMKAQEEQILLPEQPSDPGKAVPGEGSGKQYEEPKDSLTVLIDALNEQFGMNLTDADRIWFEQQRVAVLEREDLRVVALNNPRDGYRLVLDKFAEGAIIDRHEANEVLFDKFFMDDAFRTRFLAFLETTYDDFNTTRTRNS
jgi:type I restriction enzyme, R subunit